MSTCSYCYSFGHNRRGCPSRKENLKRDADKGCEWSEAQLNKKVTRRCSFCRQSGHDRRKCTSLVTSFAALEEQIYVGLTHASRAFADAGLTPGALIKYYSYAYNEQSRSYGYQDVIGILTLIRWDMITPEDLKNTYHRTSSLCLTTTTGSQISLEPPYHVFSVTGDSKSAVTILTEGPPQRDITPDRQHATRLTQRYFESKDFVLYHATSYTSRFEQHNTEYAARTKTSST
jgi:hypothetical protein